MNLKKLALHVVLALSLLACGSSAQAGFTAPVAAFKPGGALGPVAANAAWLVPNNQTTGANAALYFRTLYVPSDVTTVSLTLANRLYNGGTGSPVTLGQVAIGESAGGDVFASAPTIYTNVVVPGDGSVVTIPTTPITRGSDGSIVIAFQYPGGGGTVPVAYCPNLWVGHYHSAGSTLYPTPAFDGSDTNPLFQIWLGFNSDPSLHPPYLILGDSISVGGSTSPLTCGYAAAAWPNLGADHDLAVSVDGLPGGFLSEFADPVTYPNLWDQQNVANTNVVIQLGVNDTAVDSAATMIANFEAIASYVRAHGAASVIATTVLPNINSGYGGGANTQRLLYNTALLSSSANLVCDLCPYVWESSNHNALAAAYDSGDGLHPNAAGNAQLEIGLEACLGLFVMTEKQKRALRQMLRRLLGKKPDNDVDEDEEEKAA